MNTYTSEYSTLFTKSSENFHIFHDLYSENEDENESSFLRESSDSIPYYFNNRIYQKDSFPQSFPEEFNFPSLGESNSIFLPKEKVEKKEDQEKLYFLERLENSLPSCQSKRIEIKKETSSKKELVIAIKKRGRYKENPNLKVKTHDKYSTDNLLRKIQVHYLTFIVDFLNEILSLLNCGKKFLKLDYEFKKNVNKKNVEYLKEKKIKDIICNRISKKYRNVEYYNKAIYEQIKDNTILNNMLSENYLTLFKKIYYKSQKIINLKEYGLDKNIVLSKKVKMFNNLLNIKDNKDDDNYQYIKYLRECAIRNYLPESLFIFH